MKNDNTIDTMAVKRLQNIQYGEELRIVNKFDNIIESLNNSKIKNNLLENKHEKLNINSEKILYKNEIKEKARSKQKPLIQSNSNNMPVQNQMQGVYNHIQKQREELIRRNMINIENEEKAKTNYSDKNNNIRSKNLPDGIKYEVIDKKTLEEISALKNNVVPIKKQEKTIGMSLKEENGTTYETENNGVLKDNKQEKNIENDFKMIIIGEINAEKFYKYLLSISKNERYKDILTNIIQNNLARKQIYINIYNENYKEEFKYPEKENKFTHSYKKGIEIAISEEIKTIKEINRIYNTTKNNDLNYIINDKITDLNSLQLALNIYKS